MINNHIRLKVFVIMHYDKVFSLATISKTAGSIIDTIRIPLFRNKHRISMHCKIGARKCT